MKILILAGGKSRRMGRDKALIERPDGTRQLDHIVALARTISDELIVSTNDPSIVPADISHLPDLNPGDGPLGALASFHARHPGDPVMLIGCDQFLLDELTLRELIDQRDTTTMATGYANRLDHRPEPLCAIYESSALAKVQEKLDANDYCARHFLESLSPKVLKLTHPAAIDNANTPADLDEAFAKITDGVTTRKLRVLYFAKLREARGLNEEQIETLALTAAGLYEELRFKHRLPLKLDALRCARNGEFCDWSTRINSQDEIVFIPPVAGG